MHAIPARSQYQHSCINPEFLEKAIQSIKGWVPPFDPLSCSVPGKKAERRAIGCVKAPMYVGAAHLGPSAVSCPP